MTRLISRRVLAGIVTVWIVSMLVFAGTELLGDQARAILGQSATPDAVAALRAQLGLDRPAPERYLDWFGSFARGDMGRSLTSGVPVTDVVVPRLKNTLILAGVTALIFVPVAMILGVVSALRPYGYLDNGVSSVMLVLTAIPEFVLGTVLAVVFALWLPILPAVSLFDPADTALTHPTYLILPVLTLVAATLAPTTRMVRRSVLEVMERDFVQMARLKGVREGTLLRRHILRNALVPTVQVIALNIAWLLGGVVLVEVVFQYPGLGQSLADSVATRDTPQVQAIAVILAAGYILVNVSADVISVLLTPRAKTEL